MRVSPTRLVRINIITLLQESGVSIHRHRRHRVLFFGAYTREFFPVPVPGNGGIKLRILIDLRALHPLVASAYTALRRLGLRVIIGKETLS
jgi:hypothetical protein